MTTFAVDQHQRVIGCQAAKIGRTHDRCRVTDRLHIDVIRRHDVPDQITQIGIALIDELIAGDNVHRCRGAWHTAGYTREALARTSATRCCIGIEPANMEVGARVPAR